MECSTYTGFMWCLSYPFSLPVMPLMIVYLIPFAYFNVLERIS